MGAPALNALAPGGVPLSPQPLTHPARGPGPYGQGLSLVRPLENLLCGR
jgi:hypothetical protein